MLPANLEDQAISTNDFSQHFGLDLCLIIAKYYIYCASREYHFEALFACLNANYQWRKAANANHTEINL